MGFVPTVELILTLLVIVIVRFALPIGLGALVLMLVLRHHRRTMVRELRDLQAAQKTSASS